MSVAEEGTSWPYCAALHIGFLKEAVRQDMRRPNAPIVLRDSCFKQRSNTHNAIYRPLIPE